MRIIAGRFGRRKLLTNPGLTTRPLTDRIKEILFARLEDELAERRVADLFAGTGTIGLEALSRGARSVVFIENDLRAYELLVKNVAALKVQDETFCWRTDVLRSSLHPKGVSDLLPYDVIFFDPPYRMVETLAPGRPMYKALERLARPGIAAERALLVFRTPEHARFTMPAAWRAETVWPFSTMEVHLFRRAEPGETPEAQGAGPFAVENPGYSEETGFPEPGGPTTETGTELSGEP